MTHLDLARKFCSFSKELLNEVQKPNIIKEDELFCRRIFFSRLYYALFHKILNQSPTFQDLSGAEQHSSIKNALEKKAGKNQALDKVYQQFTILRSLRIWADYKVDDNKRAEKANLKRLQFEIEKIINQNFSL